MRRNRNHIASLFLSLCFGSAALADDMLVVVGAGGDSIYAQQFDQWAETWTRIADRESLSLDVIGPTGDADGDQDRQRLRDALADFATAETDAPLWIVLIGHGTWNGRSARFNLVGRDVAARELAEWLRPLNRPVVVINTASSSGPFIDRLSDRQRVIVTATKSGNEQNFARFGRYIADAFTSVDADLNHDDRVSVREAFLMASAETERFYRDEGRLATEHALLDDNADRKGSDRKIVSGQARPKEDQPVDGQRAARISLAVGDDVLRLTADQQQRRDRLEQRLDELVREHGDDRSALRQAALPVLTELARLYAKAEAAQEPDTEQNATADAVEPASSEPASSEPADAD